jgi:hypothetical protein
MASGFEVVGLALAVFPVLVEGLKFYVEKKGRVRDFIHYRHVLKRIIRDLSREQISFQNSSRLFLEHISMHYGLSSNDIQEMMQNPQDTRWRKGIPFQSDHLIEKSVSIYLETVEDMNEVLIKIQDTVGIREGAQVNRYSFDFRPKLTSLPVSACSTRQINSSQAVEQNHANPRRRRYQKTPRACTWAKYLLIPAYTTK